MAKSPQKLPFLCTDTFGGVSHSVPVVYSSARQYNVGWQWRVQCAKMRISLHLSSYLHFWVCTPITEADLCCCGESFWKFHHPWAALSAGWTWRLSSSDLWRRSIHYVAVPAGRIFWVGGAGAVAGSGLPRCLEPRGKGSLPRGPPECSSAAARGACGHARSPPPLTWTFCGNQS